MTSNLAMVELGRLLVQKENIIILLSSIILKISPQSNVSLLMGG
jgi:hypothetical protein